VQQQQQRFYFDHNATTPVAPEIASALVPLLTEVFGNASSIHYFGQQAKQQLELARRRVAAALGASPKEIVFTSGGTEADNLALFGTIRQPGNRKRHIVTTTIEHPAVLAACARLQRDGCEVTQVCVGPWGTVEPEHVRSAIRPGETAIVSVMHANNELGTVQPVDEIAAVAHEAGAVFHSDGVQALGKVAANVRSLGADLYAITGHKVYAPKGLGALYVREGVDLDPLLYGGRHELGRRPGTENVLLAAAFGLACERAATTAAGPGAELRDRLETGILARVPEAVVNCAGSPRLPNTSSIRFAGVDSDALVIALDLRGFAVSGGAACSSGATAPSHVLTAIGLSREEARSTIRFSLGLDNTAEQVDALIEAVAESVAHLRRMSPSSAMRSLAR
jgi:cysteine desulfurase